MRSLIFFLTFFLALSCSSSERISLKGFWQYHGKEYVDETAIVEFRDSIVLYYLENVGSYSFKYYQRKDSIVFADPQAGKGVRLESFHPDSVILHGSKTDTIVRISRTEGIEKSNLIKKSSKNIEMIPSPNR